ncbi:hypothetical protein F511_25145 [Dorcoceras hygrometricum]|uniref:Splicing factor 3B subunit 1-like n=1 Tax=Dorcoceras hygrometricum TaxID=472368 RepID=A0A2Z7CXH2_9LAMI|nr:hypothetical protein F511_25145 [Dorcoceras hygrometricum]
MKYEFKLLNDILAKSITVKAGSFDAVTHERFLVMTAIHFGIKVNWSKIIFEVLKEMVDRTTKRAKGFEAQICVLLKSDPAVTLGEANTFPPLKIVSAKTVNTYVTTKKTIDARGETDEHEVVKVAIVKKKYVSKKRSVSTAIKDTAEVQMETVAPAIKKKRTTTGKAVSKKRDLGLVSVAPEVVPIQMIEPISAVPAERHPAPKRNALKTKFRMPAGSDDELVEKEPAVEEPILDQSAGTEKMMELEKTAEIDDVDTIIEQILADTVQMETNAGEKDVEGQVEKRSDETERMINVTADEFAAFDFHVFTNEAERLVETRSDTEDEMVTAMKEESEPLSKVLETSVSPTSDDDSISLEEHLAQVPDGMMLPSLTAA